MNVTQLIERMRDILKEQPQLSTSPLTWTDAELLRNLNSAYQSLWNAARGADEQWGVDYKLLSELGAIKTTINTNLCKVTITSDLGDIVYVEADTAGGESAEAIYDTIRHIRRSGGTYWGSGTERLRWTFGATNNVLFFTDAAAVDFTKIRVWFVRHVPSLVRFGVTSFPTTSSLRVNAVTGATLGVLNTETDAYRNTWIECVTVASAAIPQGRKFYVTDWTQGTHPSYDMTLAAAHSSPSSSSWETLPLIPTPHHDAIAHLGALRALQGGGDVAAANAVAQQAGALADEFVKLVEQRQVQTPRYVNYEG